MKDFFKKYQLTIGTVALILLMGLTGWFGILPLYQQIFSLRDEIQKEIVRQQNQEKQLKYLPELKKQYDAVLVDEGYFDILLTEEKVVSFIRTVEGVASESDVEIKIQSNDAALDTPTKKKGASNNDETTANNPASDGDQKKSKLLAELLPFGNSLRLTLTLKGDYAALVKFLSRLESLPVALDVVSVEVRQPIQNDNSTEGDVRSVNPFTGTGDAGQTNKTSPDISKDGGLPAEITQPISPKLEMVVDLLVYVDKQK